MINKLTNKQISKSNNLNNPTLLNSISPYINNKEMWATPSILHKNALCNLKKTNLRILSRYKNGLYLTLSPKVSLSNGGNASIMFENKLKTAENENLSYYTEDMR